MNRLLGKFQFFIKISYVLVRNAKAPPETIFFFLSDMSQTRRHDLAILNAGRQPAGHEGISPVKSIQCIRI